MSGRLLFWNTIGSLLVGGEAEDRPAFLKRYLSVSERASWGSGVVSDFTGDKRGG